MLDKLGFDNRGQMAGTDLPGVAIVLIVAGVVLFVGIQVMSQVITQTGLEQGDPLYNASEAIESGLNDAFGLFGVAFLVVILSVVIVYLYGLRGGR
jgi:multisubunit Na+/H+ antiporter MnhB subunit